MSNEIQLALSQGQGHSLGQPAAWGGGLGPAQQQPNALKTVHRVMRGRYIIAGLLAAVFAVLFAAAGFMVSKPAYKSEAKLEIDPTIPSLEKPTEGIIAMQQLYVQSQLVKLTDERVIRAAMDDPRWRAIRPHPAPNAMEKFSANLKVDQPAKAQNWITVTYSDNSKDAKDVCQTAVACVIKAFKDIYGNDDSKAMEERINILTHEADNLQIKIDGIMHDNEVLGKDGADDPTVIRAHDERAMATMQIVQDATELYKQAQDDLSKVRDANGGQRFTVEDFARCDPEMAAQLRARGDDQLRYDTLSAQLGQRNPVVVNAKAALDARVARMQAYADQLNDRFVIRWRVDGSGGALISKDLSNQLAIIKRYQSIYEQESATVLEMRKRAMKIAQANQFKEQYQQRLHEINDDLRSLTYVRDHAVHTKYIDEDGTTPTLDKDHRPVMAALGFMGGAGLPIGVMLLIGMFDSRYRYSDETNAEAHGLTLLGILPNLPDRLSDPEQAGVAAHCVHQIRTMLQINGGADGRRVIAITSASPGDGKTSLTLALGLSYAACGTRTLLIDCDLIGAGLTARMNVSAPEGVLEAISQRSLLPFVRATDIADVAILPVGSAGNMHASTLSPNALRRLVEEAEKHFEIVLIDTGPILGSIEASLVCAAADAVVLAVSRGQQRPMVEKSLSHLSAIGARLAGVVFNRAQAHDFERSISGVSMRSQGVPNSSRARAAQLAAVARYAPPAETRIEEDAEPGEES